MEIELFHFPHILDVGRPWAGLRGKGIGAAIEIQRAATAEEADLVGDKNSVKAVFTSGDA